MAGLFHVEHSWRSGEPHYGDGSGADSASGSTSPHGVEGFVWNILRPSGATRLPTFKRLIHPDVTLFHCQDSSLGKDAALEGRGGKDTQSNGSGKTQLFHVKHKRLREKWAES